MSGRAENRGLKSTAGFTLLEVLVATVVLGTAVAALFSLLSGALSNARRLQGPEQALLLGRSRMNELLAASEQGRNFSELALDRTMEGRWEKFDDTGFRWEALATRVAPEAEPQPGQPMLVRITLDVYWRAAAARPGEDEKKIALETFQLWQTPPRGTP